MESLLPPPYPAISRCPLFSTRLHKAHTHTCIGVISVKGKKKEGRKEEEEGGRGETPLFILQHYLRSHRHTFSYWYTTPTARKEEEGSSSSSDFSRSGWMDGEVIAVMGRRSLNLVSGLLFLFFLPLLLILRMRRRTDDVAVSITIKGGRKREKTHCGKSQESGRRKGSATAPRASVQREEEREEVRISRMKGKERRDLERGDIYFVRPLFKKRLPKLPRKSFKGVN